jgi:hypothetical protein
MKQKLSHSFSKYAFLVVSWGRAGAGRVVGGGH